MLPFLILAGCGSDADAPDDETSSTGGQGSGGSGAQSGGASSSGAAGSGGFGAGSNVPADPQHAGIVQVMSGSFESDGEVISGTFAMAFFFDAPGAGAGECTHETYGACEVTRCTGGMPAETLTTLSAGEISIVGKETLTIVPDASNEYQLAFDTDPLWDAGQKVTISAEGADVPAFSHAQNASSAVTITSPAAPPRDTPMTIDRSADLVVAWNGDSTGVLTSMWKGDGSDPFVTIRCLFPLAEGSGTIPSEALQALPEGGTGDVLMIGGYLETIAAGDYTIQLVVNSAPTWGPGVGSASFVTEN